MGYDFEEVAPSVWLVHNFLTKNDLDRVWDIINSSEQQDWEQAYRKSQELLALTKFNRTDIDNLISEGLMEYTDNWYDKNIHFSKEVSEEISKNLQNLFNEFSEDLYISNFEGIQRQYPGVELKEHVDGDAHPQIEYAAIAYVNDNYSGGEVFFSKLGLRIVPPEKSLLIFISSPDHVHGVEKVLEGPTRYVLPTFIYHYLDN